MTTQIQYADLHQAVSAIAARCDGAIEQDGIGFNGQDTKFGRRVAAMPVETWTTDIAVEVSRILPVYRVQLASCGIDIKDLNLVNGDDNRQGARKEAWQAEHARKNSPYIDFHDGRIRVFNSYSIMGDLKPNGFVFDRPSKSWVKIADGNSANTVLGIGSIIITDDQRLILDALVKEFGVTQVVADKATNITLGNDGRLVMQTEFNQVPLAIIRAIPGRKWDGYKKVNYIDANIAVLNLVEVYSLTISDDAVKAIESNRAANEAAIAKAQERYADSIATDTDKEVALADYMRPYQRAGSAYMVDHGNALNGDDMGLGKTCQSISWAETLGLFPLLITCPPNAVLNWKREINNLLPNRSTVVYSGRFKGAIELADVIIIGHATLASYVVKAEKVGKKRIVTPIGVLPDFKGFIIDESHKVKNPDALLTAACHELSNSVYDNGGNVSCLTGTPMPNRSKELVEQLVMLRILSTTPKTENSVGWFLYKFCDPQNNGWGTTFNGNTNGAELNEFLRIKGMVRRKKENVLTELPKLIKAPQFIALSDDDLETYERLAQEGAEKAAQSSAEALVYMNACRSAVGTAKIGPAIEFALDFLESGKSLVIFADHKNVQQALINAISAATDNDGKPYYVTRILGAQSPAMTESQKADFQSGRSRVIVCSFKAANTAHTLTAASDVLHVELGWNPSEHDQATSRANRFGQKFSVTEWILVAQDTHDEWTAELIENKRKGIEAGIDGVMAIDASESVFNEVLDRMISKYGNSKGASKVNAPKNESQFRGCDDCGKVTDCSLIDNVWVCAECEA